LANTEGTVVIEPRPVGRLPSDERLFILAFDHRGSFQRDWFAVDGKPSERETLRIADGKELIFEGLEAVLHERSSVAGIGALVDEQFGAPKRIPARAKEKGIRLAMPVERSDQAEFQFEYGEAFAKHIERFDPDFAKVLVRYNPDGDREMNARQTERLRRLSEWLHASHRRFLFELLVPALSHQLDSVGGDPARYEREIRPELTCRAIEELQGAGVEVDIWKLEGMETRADCARIASQCRAGGRNDAACVVLGRGADVKRVDRWLAEAAPVEGFVGFAIGRSIWGEPLHGFLRGELDRSQAAARVAANFLGFAESYERAALN
jgi:myo-inositol catabolism protein IolC